jgi:hypothetical protein
MKSSRVVLPLLILLSLALSGSLSAADLQEGWYANTWGVHVYEYDDQGRSFLRALGYFYTTPPGQYGPFLVTGGSDDREYKRYVSVPAQAIAEPSDTLTMRIDFGMTIGESVAWIELPWATNYDSTQMRYSLWRDRYGDAQELVWSQPISGMQNGYVYVGQDTVYEGAYYLKVEVVPEPQAGCSLLVMIPVMLGLRRRR